MTLLLGNKEKDVRKSEHMITKLQRNCEAGDCTCDETICTNILHNANCTVEKRVPHVVTLVVQPIVEECHRK
jgi:hypothetical protein